MDPEADAARDELRDLRRRVYGPHPDLANDPEAHARLAALGSAPAVDRGAVPEIEPTPPAHPSPDPAPDEAREAPVDPERDPEDAAPPAGSRDPRRRRLSPRAFRAVAAASLAVTVVITAGATLWLTRERVDTVALISFADEAEESDGTFDSASDGAIQRVEFLGLTVSRMPRDPTSLELSDDCISVLPIDVDPSAVVGVYGCGAGSVPATVPMNVTPDLPSLLREAFPAGTTLLFALEGDAVRISRVGG